MLLPVIEESLIAESHRPPYDIYVIGVYTERSEYHPDTIAVLRQKMSQKCNGARTIYSRRTEPRRPADMLL